MCEERERLIGYVYDECDAAERREMERHLEGCPTCRREIAGLRGVRQDLLAWSVPEHESVWRPVPAPRVESSWHALPAWAMAAAAGVMLMVGAAGGAATYAFLPQGARQVAPSAASATASVSALESRIAALERVNANLAGQLQNVSTKEQPVDVNAIRARADELERRLRSVANQQDVLTEALMNNIAYATDIRTRQSAFEKRTNNFLQASLPLGEAPQGFGGR